MSLWPSYAGLVRAEAQALFRARGRADERPAAGGAVGDTPAAASLTTPVAETHPAFPPVDEAQLQRLFPGGGAGQSTTAACVRAALGEMECRSGD